MSYSDYFLIFQPDYLEEIFDFYPENSISFSAERHQGIENIDGINYVFDYSNSNQGTFSFDLENLTQAERDELIDFYLNANKSNGISNSFLFKHPIYNEYFVCKFNNEFNDSVYRHGRYTISNIEFDVIGIDSNMINYQTWIVGSLPTTDYNPT